MSRRKITNFAALAAILTMFAASPAMAQALDLSPLQAILQGLVDTFTGPLGMVMGTLAVIGVFVAWFFGRIDFMQGFWIVVAIAGIAAAPTIVATIWT